MSPVLHPEILQTIIRQACTADDGSVRSKRERQRDLADLMVVSKVFNELCTIELYQDCTVHHLQPFLATLFPDPDLKKNPRSIDLHFRTTLNPTKEDQLARTKVLRVCHSRTPIETTYEQVLESPAFGWQLGGFLRYPNDPSPPEYSHSDRIVTDASEFCDAGVWLRLIIRSGHRVLPNLERVVMMGDADDQIAMVINHFPQGFPDMLLNLPSAKFYCQSSFLGPLSIRNVIHRPLHPPNIVTLHIANSDLCCRWAASLPIVVGATNRYILSSPVNISSSQPLALSDIDEHSIRDLSAVIVEMLHRTDLHRDQPHNNGPERFAINSVSLDGTKIEMYNLVGNLIVPAPRAGRGQNAKKIMPLNLEVRQALARLIDTRTGLWKGKVSFHNLDDIPLCPACQVPDKNKPALSGVMDM